jgi:ATP synthase protein I
LKSELAKFFTSAYFSRLLETWSREAMEKGAGGREGQDQSSLKALTRYSGHGLTLAAAVGLFLLAGWWLDGRVGTTPLFTILGALVGAAAGFYHLIQHLLLLPRAREKERAEGKGNGGRDDRAGG